MMLAIVWAVWLVINLITFILYGVDKQRAKSGEWRVSEKKLLAYAWLLGGVGAWLAMGMFRHKTRHIAFRVSAPIGALLSISLMLLASAKLLNIF